jgi:hypothetical protein
MKMPPYTSELIKRKELNEADIKKYEAKLKKKNDAYAKKAKKKQKMQKKNKMKLMNIIRN